MYSYDKGQIKYEENKRKCGRKRIMHEKDEEFIEYVEMMISDYHYSPAAIMEEIKRDGMEYKTKICLTTFYNYIKAGVFPNVVLADLPYRRKKKIKRKQKVQKRFSKGTSIDKRPKEIETREEVGHWEMDSVVGAQGEGEKTVACFN
ncbi:MAG: IS30 family transposase [Eubacterium sp.]|uniref:IS30 family transposase n=1 Tax=Eubacterium sp. TaxID=142586 RepID=UPI0039942140